MATESQESNSRASNDHYEQASNENGSHPEDYEEGEETYGEDEEQTVEDGAESGRDDIAGIYNPDDVNDQIFEELHMHEEIVQDVQHVWDAFVRSGSTRDAAGEALYAAVFDAAPSLQNLFKTPRAVMAMRFINGLNQIVAALNDPPTMKVIVETLGFQHMELEVTVPRVVIFRDAITELLAVELGPMMTTRAREGMMTLLNYVGGAYIYIRVKYTERLKILSTSWATANNRKYDENGETQKPSDEVKEAEKHDHSDESEKKQKRRFFGRDSGKREGSSKHEGGDTSQAENGRGMSAFRNTAVPTTYNEMFMFNAAVMGFGNNEWMQEVLMSFDAIVQNVSNSGRLQEECDVLSLRISKYKGTTINLPEYKAVMLASLRSLVPKDWNSAHEISWSWLWENVERMIRANLGKPAVQEKALSKLLNGLDEKTRAQIRRDVYSTFFVLAPAGQDFFKQSTTRLHFIADRIVAMTLEIYKDANKMVQDISALGLRHVGYGIAPELFGPFVTACVNVVRSFSEDDIANEAFRWSLGLVSRILVRVISEGSTIVMKAINVNSARQLRKAIACAPRGKRALWMLNVQVGTQSISPLLWAIETSSLEAAKAIIADLLTIRADRDRYYYGMDTLFERHPDIVRRLVQDAPALLTTLFDGLIWRSRTTENGMRRVNYYIKHCLVDAEGDFSQTIQWIVENGDPKIVCHPVIAMITDITWSRIAFRTFLYGKTWVMFTLVLFILGVAAFQVEDDSQSTRFIVAACRLFIYICSMCPRIYGHVRRTFNNVKNKEIIRAYHVPIPKYLTKWQDVVCLLLTLILIAMLIFEPVIACLGSSEENKEVFTQVCESGRNVQFVYSVFTMIATVLYFLLIVDLSVFSTRVSAFVLICFRVMNEVWLYILGMMFVILTFSCAVSSLQHSSAEFETIPQAAMSLMEVSLLMFEARFFYELHSEPALFITVVLYIIVAMIFLLNLLIAQMNCAYQCVYEDMVGYARLNRGKVVTESMQNVRRWRWDRFVQSLHFDEPCEFGEGDIGLSGAIQVMEPASQNITTVESIRRFGGSTAMSAQWPEEETTTTEEDRFAHMEKMLEKAMRKMSSRDKRGGSSKGGGSSMDRSGSSNNQSGTQASEAASDGV